MNSLTTTMLLLLAETRREIVKLESMKYLTGMEPSELMEAAQPLVDRGLAEWRLKRGGKRSISITETGMAKAGEICKSAIL